MIILNKWEMSQWAYHECENGNNSREMRLLISENYWICRYCFWIQDIEEMWSKITEPDWAECYCENVKNRPEVRKYIK